MGMTQDESSLQELAARLARIEQENAALRAKLVSIQTTPADLAAQQEPTPVSLTHQLVDSTLPPLVPGKPVRSLKRRLPIWQIPLLVLLILLIGGASYYLYYRSSAGPTQHLPETSTVAPLESPGAPSRPIPSVPLGTSVSFNLGGWLHIQSGGGFTCSFSTQDPLTPGTLVLPTVQPTYDQGTLQSVENYLTAVSTGGDLDIATERRDTIPYPPFSANPNAFQLLPVGGAGFGGPGNLCDEIVHITNSGKTPVQIAQVSALLTADTHTNTQHYNLIDVCSLPAMSARIQACGPLGSGGEPVYRAYFALQSGKAGTTIAATNWDTQSPLIQPGGIAKVIIYYSAMDNLSFSLVPTFTLAWPGTGKQITYTAPQLQETFAFASASQFSCYDLQGQHFIEVPQNFRHWCI